MLEESGPERDSAGFVLPDVGQLVQTPNPWEPYRLLDQHDIVVEPVRAFFAELQACAKPATTIRSYGMDLLRWWRFLIAWDTPWDRASRVDTRDFVRWMQLADKPVRVHWRHRRAGLTAETAPKPQRNRRRVPGVPNPITEDRGAPLFSSTQGVPTPGARPLP